MKTILTIDPNQADLEHLKRCLLKIHPESNVLSYTDPLLAFQYAFNHKVDALFTAIYMRRLDGYRLANMVREVHPEITIYFTEVNTKAQKGAIQRDATGYLLKPITQESIYRVEGKTKRKEQSV